jgi:hypothetical protein
MKKNALIVWSIIYKNEIEELREDKIHLFMDIIRKLYDNLLLLTIILLHLCDFEGVFAEAQPFQRETNDEIINN